MRVEEESGPRGGNILIDLELSPNPSSPRYHAISRLSQHDHVPLANGEELHEA
jgi:hypothetical protein